MSVSLQVVAGDDLLLIADTPERIVGFTSQPDTVKTLAPGDRVVIRGKGRWRLLSETPAAVHARRTAPARRVGQSRRIAIRPPHDPRPAGISTPVQVLLQPR